ncbi:MAG: enoyl-CoA hydratase/isomerase family protein [Dehalococcoidia bacterium]
MKDYLDILTSKKDRHAIIQLNRPEKMNALSHNLRAELFDALKDFEMDPEVKVIIIRGSGRAFSAGYDLSGSRRPRTTVTMSKAAPACPRLAPSIPARANGLSTSSAAIGRSGS